MSEPKEVTLRCLICGETGPHLIWYTHHKHANGLPYIMGHQQCQACEDRRPYPTGNAIPVGPEEVRHMLDASADDHSNFGTM